MLPVARAVIIVDVALGGYPEHGIGTDKHEPVFLQLYARVVVVIAYVGRQASLDWQKQLISLCQQRQCMLKLNGMKPNIGYAV
ncbi:hypothetical protein M2399_005850 [Pseudomonas sp. BIGb0450]|nr:hypothetical protein [Pseudomonas sp. BIGb0558]MCS3440388.1 hypothetical protein [Pseudomonas sp. BIGb0450]